MKKFYYCFASRFSAICLLLLVCAAAFAQGTVQIGFGGNVPAASLYSPMCRVSASSTNDFSRSNIVYTASELAAAGIMPGSTITKLAFNKRNDGATVATSSNIVFQIWMKNSSLQPPLSSTTWASIAAGHTMVYSNNNEAVPATNGWLEYTLTNPFLYTGGSLEIATHFDISAVAGSPTTNFFQWEYTAGFETSIIGAIGTSAPATLGIVTAYCFRPNIQITTTLPACTAPPTAGTVTAPATVCPGANFNLGLSGASSGSGMTYRWQQSTDNATWADIPGATAAAITLNQLGNTYFYRAILTCSGQSSTTPSVQVTTLQPLAGNYTINPAAPASATNFVTLADLAAQLNCAGITGPVVATLLPGTHTGRFLLGAVNGSSSANTITIEGNGQTLLYSTATSAERPAMQLNGSQYVTVRNLTVNVIGNTYGWGIHLTNGASFNNITNNTILADTAGAASANYAGIVASGSTTSITSGGNNANDLRITGNTIVGGMHGVVLTGNANLDSNNVVSDNIIRDMGETGVYLLDQYSAVVSGNDISRPRRALVNFFRGVFIDASAATVLARNNLVEKNRIHDSHTGALSSTAAGYGIYISADATGGEENRIINNLIYKFNGNGTHYGIWSTGSDGSHIFHNTVVLDDQLSAAGDARGLYQSTAATNVQFVNNLVVVTRTGSGTKVAMYFGTTASVQIVSNYNALYVPPATATYFIGSFGTSTKVTLADWQATNGNAYDQNSVAANPLFANAAGGNFKPGNGAVDGAAMLTQPVNNVTTDFFGVTRDVANPDPGAIEWTAIANDASVSGFIQPTAVPYCADTLQVVFTVTNAGAAGLTAVTLNWTVNNVAQTPKTFTGLALAPGESANLVLGTITVAANTFYTIRAVSSNPNGVTDLNTSNDAFTRTNWRSSLRGTYTINKYIPNTEYNFNSVNDFSNALKNLGVCNAVTAEVSPGTGPYTEHVEFTAVPGGSATNAVTLRGNGNALEFTATNTSTRTAFSTLVLDGIKNFTLDSLTVNGLSTSAAYGINIINGASDIIIRKCSINIPLSITSSTSAAGISTAGQSNYLNGTTLTSRNITITGNTVTGGGNGIIMVGQNAPALRHVNISVTNNTLVNQESEAIQVLGVDTSLVSGNTITRPGKTASSTAFTGIYYWNATEAFRIEKNRIHTITGTGGVRGMYVLGNKTFNSSGTIINNLMYGWTSTGYQYGIEDNMDSAANVSVYHNTIVLADGAYAGTAITRAYYWSATNSKATNMRNVQNNIFFINRGGTGAKYLIDVASNNNTGTLNSNNNVLWFGAIASGSTTAPVFGRFVSTNFTTFAAWQGAGKDLNSVNADPVFSNVAIGNYVPSDPSVDNIGAPAGITTDLVGNVRSATTPDAGAYEFTAGAVVTVFRFTGNGNWSDAANWSGGNVPASPLPAGKQIIIEPAGTGVCMLNVPFTIAAGAQLTVAPGKQLVVQGNLIQQ